MTLFLQRYFPAMMLIVIVAAVYAHSLTHDFVNLDDPLLITENPIIQSLSLSSIGKAFTSYDPELYIPLTLLSYQLDAALFGMRPFVFHLTNLLLHMGSTLLVYSIMRRFFTFRVAAWFVAVLFAIHPVQVEAVAWAAARKDVLSSFFGLASILLYMYYRESHMRSYLIISVLAFFLGLLAKVGIALLPLVLLMIDLYQRRRDMRKALIEKVPYIAFSFIFIAVAVIGKAHVLDTLSIFQEFCLAVISSAFSLSKIVWPVGLSAMYPYADPVYLTDWRFVTSLIVVIGISVAGYRSIERTRRGMFAVGLFFLFLLPAFATFSKGDTVYITSDRYVYLAVLGPFFLMGFLIDDALKRRNLVIPLAAASLILVLFLTSAVRVRVWRNSESLNRDIIEEYPGDYRAQFNLGLSLKAQNRSIEAAERYLKVLEMKPDNADALVELGILYAEEHGPTEESERKFRDAIARFPNHTHALQSFAVVLMQRGKADEAIVHLTHALDIDPYHARSRHTLAEAYGSLRMFDQAIKHYKLLAELNPAYAATINLPEFK